MENKQTTVIEWLKNNLEQHGSPSRLDIDWETLDELIEQAKAMEKEQIEESFKHGRLPVMLGSFQAKDYYKLAYGKETDSN